MINLCSYFTDKKYGRHFGTPNIKNAYEHIANPKNTSMIKAACIHLEVIKRVMSSSSSSSSPPCSPFFPSLVGLCGRDKSTSSCLQSLPYHGLRLDPAVHAGDPLHHPLGKRDLEDFEVETCVLSSIDLLIRSNDNPLDNNNPPSRSWRRDRPPESMKKGNLDSVSLPNFTFTPTRIAIYVFCTWKSFWGTQKTLSISPEYRRRQWLAFCFSSEASWRIFNPLERLFSCKIPVIDI